MPVQSSLTQSNGEDDWETEEEDEGQDRVVSTRKIFQSWRDGSEEEEENGDKDDGEDYRDPEMRQYDRENFLWSRKLNGRRLVTHCAAFTTLEGGRVFHNAPQSSVSVPSWPPAAASSRFLLLPLEIRRSILFHVLTAARSYEMMNRKKTARGETSWLSYHRDRTAASVMFACKQLYIESREIALEAYTFVYEDLPTSKIVMKESHCRNIDNSVRR